MLACTSLTDLTYLTYLTTLPPHFLKEPDKKKTYHILQRDRTRNSNIQPTTLLK